MKESQYRKTWLAVTTIARGLIGTDTRCRIPTIQFYTDLLDSSRGIVQNALEQLETSGAVKLEKRGKMGTYLVQKDLVKLFEQAGLQYITGSMPAPLNIHLAGLATGVCQAMTSCVVPFTFAFVQGAQNRIDALRRTIYDFVIVTQATAAVQTAQYEELTVAAVLDRCRYAPPYALFINRPGITALQDGMTIAVDPTSTDQMALTKRLCAGRDVKLIHMPFTATRVAFFSGEVDSTVYRYELPDAANSIAGWPVQGDGGELKIDLDNISVILMEDEESVAMERPVVMVNRNNYGIADIVRVYLQGDLVAKMQREVVERRMAPRFF